MPTQLEDHIFFGD